ncbi:MAG: segregation/condensation protein A [Candidatus Omnitrophica bacterium]|nr:segregation/condensation protein A [Candidatus Omnitrophota bacterium]
MTYRVTLPVFEGPLDLLLFLIKQNHIDITNLPIADVVEQYLEYLGLMQILDLEIAGDFLVMAATLLQIKSTMLLPPEETPPEEDEPDPRAELIRKLLEYQQFKAAADRLQDLERQRLAVFTRTPPDGQRLAEEVVEEPFFEASLFDLLTALSKVLRKVPKEIFHEIVKDEFTVEQKTEALRAQLMRQPCVAFSRLFEQAKSKLEVITTFLALLELIRQRFLVARQGEMFGEILIVRADHVETTATVEKMSC